MDIGFENGKPSFVCKMVIFKKFARHKKAHEKHFVLFERLELFQVETVEDDERVQHNGLPILVVVEEIVINRCQCVVDTTAVVFEKDIQRMYDVTIDKRGCRFGWLV